MTNGEARVKIDGLIEAHNNRYVTFESDELMALNIASRTLDEAEATFTSNKPTMSADNDWESECERLWNSVERLKEQNHKLRTALMLITEVMADD